MFIPALILDRKIWALAARNAKEGKSLDLKKDIIFKLFFGGSSTESAYCRCHMLSAVIGRKVLEARVVNPQLLSLLYGRKNPVLDLHCVLEDGSEVDVEIQGKYYKDEFVKRSVYYASKLVSESLGRGKNYVTLPHSYQITFMNFVTEQDDRLHHAYMLYERDSKDLLTDLMQIHFVELPKIKKIAEKPLENLSDIEFWSMLIFAGDDPQIKRWLAQFTEHKEELTMANALLHKLSGMRRNWAFQLSDDRWTRDWTSRWYTGIDNAREEGIAIGEERGIAIGEAQGERNAKLETARLMLANKLPITDIAKYTGLSAEEIQQLQQSTAQ